MAAMGQNMSKRQALTNRGFTMIYLLFLSPNRGFHKYPVVSTHSHTTKTTNHSQTVHTHEARFKTNKRHTKKTPTKLFQQMKTKQRKTVKNAPLRYKPIIVSSKENQTNWLPRSKDSKLLLRVQSRCCTCRLSSRGSRFPTSSLFWNHQQS